MVCRGIILASVLPPLLKSSSTAVISASGGTRQVVDQQDCLNCPKEGPGDHWVSARAAFLEDLGLHHPSVIPQEGKRSSWPDSITLSTRTDKDHNPIVMAIAMQQTWGTFPRLLYLYLTPLKQKEAEHVFLGFPCVLKKAHRKLRQTWDRCKMSVRSSLLRHRGLLAGGDLAYSPKLYSVAFALSTKL